MLPPNAGSRLKNWDSAVVARRIRITQVRSAVGRRKIQRRTLRALGIRRHQQAVVHDDTPAIRGMIAKVDYLVEVTPAEDTLAEDTLAEDTLEEELEEVTEVD